MAPRLSQGIGPAGRQPPVGGTGGEVLAGFGLLPTQHMGLDFHKLTFLHELGQAREDTCLTLARLFWAAGGVGHGHPQTPPPLLLDPLCPCCFGVGLASSGGTMALAVMLSLPS